MACKLYLWAMLLTAATAAAFAVDVPVADYCRRHLGDSGWKKHVSKLFSLSEVYAHAFGAAAILATAFVLDPAQRRRFPRTLACVTCGGIAGNLAKHIIARWRPRERVVESVWDSFNGWLPWWDWESMRRSTEHYGLSFPSGHAATAAALAIGLMALYPRGRWLFAGFAVLAALQRIDVTAHYPSDTLAAAAVACAVCGTVFDSRLTGRWFDRLEKAG